MFIFGEGAETFGDDSGTTEIFELEVELGSLS
jgi:hypothetical protein